MGFDPNQSAVLSDLSTLSNDLGKLTALAQSDADASAFSGSPQSSEGKIVKRIVESMHPRMDIGIFAFLLSGQGADINVQMFKIFLQLLQVWESRLESGLYYGEEELAVCRAAKAIRGFLNTAEAEGGAPVGKRARDVRNGGKHIKKVSPPNPEEIWE